MLDPTGVIKKANLKFSTKFVWILVRHLLSPKAAESILIWDRAFLVVALVEGFEVGFSRLLLAVIHGKSFKDSTTYPFPYIIFELCRAVGVFIWNIDVP